MTGIHTAIASEEVMPVPKGKVFRNTDLYTLYIETDNQRYNMICIVMIIYTGLHE